MISPMLIDIDSGEYINELGCGQDFAIEIRYESNKVLEGIFFGYHKSNKDGQRQTGQRMQSEITRKPFTITKNSK